MLRYRHALIAAAALIGVAGATAQYAPAVPSGHYYRYAPKKVKNRLVWPRVNDTADISPLSADRVLVHLDLAATAPQCRFTGIARPEGQELVYREAGGDPTRACQLVLTSSDGRLRWSDNRRCQARCPSGGLAGELPLAHRGAAKRAATLPGYAEAVAETDPGR
jgi:hypothetical protein